jgi:hypothetical protein
VVVVVVVVVVCMALGGGRPLVRAAAAAAAVAAAAAWLRVGSAREAEGWHPWLSCQDDKINARQRDEMVRFVVTIIVVVVS